MQTSLLLSTVNPGSNTICRCCTCRRRHTWHTWNTGARNSSDGGKEQDEVTKTPSLCLKVNHGSQIPVISFCFETLHLTLMMSMTGVNGWMTAVRNNFELIAYWRKLSTSNPPPLHKLCNRRGKRYRSLCTSPVLCAPHTSGYQMHHQNPDINVSLLINGPNTPHHYIIISQQADCRYRDHLWKSLSVWNCFEFVICPYPYLSIHPCLHIIHLCTLLHNLPTY